MTLKELRNSRGWTQEEVAEKLCITRAAYTNIENGKRQLDATTIIKLVDIFGVSADIILGLPEKKKSLGVLNGKEHALLRMYRQLPTNEQDVFYKMLEGLNASAEKRETQSCIR